MQFKIFIIEYYLFFNIHPRQISNDETNGIGDVR